MTDNATIIEAAKLKSKLESITDHRLVEHALFEWKAAVAKLDSSDHELMVMAERIVEGKPYIAMSDNPDRIQRYRSVANDLGATVKDGGNAYPMPEGMMAITIIPPVPKP